MAKNNDFTADSIQIGSIKRSLSESSDGDLVLTDKFYPGGVRLRDIGQFNVALKIDALEGVDEDNIIVFSNDGKLKDSGIAIADIPSSFITLNDSPATYTGNGGRFLKVNTAEDAVEFVAVDIDLLQSQITINANNITSLTATVDSNADFVNNTVVPAINAISGGAQNFLELLDSPSTYPTSAGGQVVAINSSTDGLEFYDVNTPIANLQSQLTALNNSQTFLDLSDTPSTFAGSDLYVPQVSGSELVFVPFSSLTTDFVTTTALSGSVTVTDLTATDSITTGDLTVTSITVVSGGVFTFDTLNVQSISGVDAYEVDYDNSGSTLSANNVETALTELDNDLNNIQTTIRGQEALNTTDLVYSIDFGLAITGTPIPVVTLVSPTSGGTTHVESIFDVTDTGFYVELNEVPAQSGYMLNWSVERANFSKGDDVNEKTFDLANVILPSVDPATLDTASNASGFDYYVVDYQIDEVAFFNFMMTEQFKDTGVLEVEMLLTCAVAGNSDFGINVDDLGDGDNPATSIGHLLHVDNVVFTAPNEIVKKTLTLSKPTYQDINKGDLVIFKLRRLIGGTIGANPLRLVGLKFKW